MCFSAQQSLLFGTLGASAVGLLLYRGRSWKYVSLALYFTVMEVLQFAQYLVIDRCDSKVNQLLTWLAYVHVSLQPVVFNEFVWGQPQAIFNKPVISPEADRILHWTVRRLAMAASGFLILKGTPALLQLLGLSHWSGLRLVLGSKLAAHLSSTSSCGPSNQEMICGQQLCSFSGKYHVGWSVPQLAHSYYIPTAFIHGFFFFVPALVLGGLPQWVLSLAAFFTGPVLTEIILGGDADARRHEWASIWCMFSLGQVLLLFTVELIGSKVLLGNFHIPTADEDCKPGSIFSNLLDPSIGDQEGARKRAAGKRSSIAGNGDAADAEVAAVEAVAGIGSVAALRQMHVPARDGRQLSALQEGVPDEGQLTPRRSARLRQRAVAFGAY